MYWASNPKMILILSELADEYINNGKTIEDFENDHGLKIIPVTGSCEIEAVWFQKPSNKTAFMLKYNS